MADLFSKTWEAVKSSTYNTYKGAATSFTPILVHSKFLEEGVLTPEEFVSAGDLLVYKCPTWSWASGVAEKRVEYLPADKQFLITRGVPCKSRFHDDTFGTGDIVDDDWLSVASQVQAEAADEIPEIDADEKPKQKEADEDLDNIPDMDDFNSDNNVVENDPAAVQKPVANVEKNRTYDISITYDKYHRTPTVWLFGYSESQQPLKAEDIYMDISEDHAKKTVTLGPHPHLATAWTYIHPCRHASVMKKFVQRMIERDLQPRVDQYLLLFLKFMGAVMPTIAYDNTFDIGL